MYIIQYLDGAVLNVISYIVKEALKLKVLGSL